jgi:GH25 family lysozyme M1 (1,4-beta-N-acetylmuramidase)
MKYKQRCSIPRNAVVDLYYPQAIVYLSRGRTKKAMKLLATAYAAAAVLGVARATVQGFDISNYQSSVDFTSAYNSGARFVIIKVSRRRIDLLGDWFLAVLDTRIP